MPHELVDDVAESIRTAEPHVTTGAELARELDEPKQDVLQALRTLEYASDVASKETGANAIAWWSTERVSPAPDRSDDELGLGDVQEDEPSEDHEYTDRIESTGDRRPDRDGADVMGDAIAAADLPGSGAKLERRRDALERAVLVVETHGEISAQELREDVHEAIDTGYSSPRSLWKNALLPALSEIADQTDELEKADETGRWRWRA